MRIWQSSRAKRGIEEGKRGTEEAWAWGSSDGGGGPHFRHHREIVKAGWEWRGCGSGEHWRCNSWAYLVLFRLATPLSFISLAPTSGATQEDDYGSRVIMDPSPRRLSHNELRWHEYARWRSSWPQWRDAPCDSRESEIAIFFASFAFLEHSQEPLQGNWLNEYAWW